MKNEDKDKWQKETKKVTGTKKKGQKYTRRGYNRTEQNRKKEETKKLANTEETGK
jgi:hypothetical protein